MSLQTELNELMSRKGYSQTQVARAFGKSPAVVNQYLQGKYQGDVGSIDELARSFIRAEHHASIPPFRGTEHHGRGC